MTKKSCRKAFVECTTIGPAQEKARASSGWGLLLSSSRRPSARPIVASVRRRMRTARPDAYRTRAWLLGLHACGFRLPVPRMRRMKLHEPSPALMFTNFCTTDFSSLRSIRCFSEGFGGNTSRLSTKIKGCASMPALEPPMPSSPPVSRPCFH